MADNQRQFNIHGETPISENFGNIMKATFAELEADLSNSGMSPSHQIALRMADILAATHAAVHELESRVNQLEDHLKK